MYEYVRETSVNAVGTKMLRKMFGEDEALTASSKVDLSCLLPCPHWLLTSREVIIVYHVTNVMLQLCLSAQNLFRIKCGKCQRQDIQSLCTRKDHFYRHPSQTFSIVLTLMLKQRMLMKWISIGKASQMMKIMDINRRKNKCMVQFPDVFFLLILIFCIGIFGAMFI